MTKEEIQKNSEHWYNKYKDAEKRITELENKIADIKANCDFAIEGRDIMIDELEEKNSQMFNTIALQEQQIEHLREERNYFQEKCEDIELNYYCDHKGVCKAQELEKEIAELKIHHKKVCEVLTDTHRDLGEQIEKMKCCENCKHHYKAEDNDTYCYKCIVDEISLWELKE